MFEDALIWIYRTTVYPDRPNECRRVDPVMNWDEHSDDP